MKLSFLLLTLFLSQIACEPTYTPIKYVSVIFRHGNRTPDPPSLYPTDPYLNESYYPYGLGSLTNEGKLRMYKIGQTLRQKYKLLLGDTYLTGSIYVQSTDVERTKMCALLVLAGLWPPSSTQSWKENFSWQPIPYRYTPLNQDSYLGYFFCPAYKKEYDALRATPQLQTYEKSKKDTYEKLSKYMGTKIGSTADLYMKYFGLAIEEELGLELPEWTKSVYPDVFYEGTLLEYDFMNYNKKLMKYTSGALLKRILEQAKERIENPMIARRMSLFSSHDVNVMAVLKGLGANYATHIPGYGAYISIEFHKTNGQLGMKVYYAKDGLEEPKELTIAGCKVTLCPLKTVEEYLKDILPNDNEYCYGK